MTRSYEASVLSIEPRGDYQLATVRIQGLGTLAVNVSANCGVQVGDVRELTVTMHLGRLLARETESAAYR